LRDYCVSKFNGFSPVKYLIFNHIFSVNVKSAEERVVDLENAIHNVRLDLEKEQKCRKKVQRENQSLKLHVDRTSIENTRSEADIFERLQTTVSRFEAEL